MTRNPKDECLVVVLAGDGRRRRQVCGRLAIVDAPAPDAIQDAAALEVALPDTTASERMFGRAFLLRAGRRPDARKDDQAAWDAPGKVPPGKPMAD